jgi:hypothetical protein
MKPQPHALKVGNWHRVHNSQTAKKSAADQFRQRMIDAALKRALATLTSADSTAKDDAPTSP